MKKLAYLILPIITIIFEALPLGVICNVPAVEGEAFNDKFSYFSSIPMDYNYFAPFVTAILTCIFTLLLLIYCFTNKKQLLNIAKYLVCTSAGFALGALFLGIKITSIGIIITATLILEAILIFVFDKKLEK